MGGKYRVAKQNPEIDIEINRSPSLDRTAKLNDPTLYVSIDRDVTVGTMEIEAFRDRHELPAPSIHRDSQRLKESDFFIIIAESVARPAAPVGLYGWSPDPRNPQGG